MLSVREHTHWIPGKILPYFDPSHLSVAHQEAKLEIVYKFRTGTGSQNGYPTANFFVLAVTEKPRPLL